LLEVVAAAHIVVLVLVLVAIEQHLDFYFIQIQFTP